MKKSNNNLVIKLKSIMLNNRKKPNILTICLYIAFVGWYIAILTYDGFSFLLSIIGFVFLILLFLSSPRGVMLTEKGLEYNLGWKETWDNISNYKLHGKTIILETKTGKVRLISDIAEEDIPAAMKYIEGRLSQVKAPLVPPARRKGRPAPVVKNACHALLGNT